MDIKLASIFVVLSLVELGIVWFKAPLRAQRIVAGLLVMLLSAVQAAILYDHFSVSTAVFFAVGLLRVVNLMRLALARMQPEYLKATVRRSSLLLLAIQLTALGLVMGAERLGDIGLGGLLATAGLLNFSIALSAWRNTRKYSVSSGTLPEKNLPTVTVAIPARNETEDLARCIESVLAVDYPKLEVLVLDDCSQDKTPEIIKSFAHRGVRFVDGEEPTDSWLPKNAACQKLLDEASGEYVIFCGVDVRFSRESVKNLLAIIQQRKLGMVGLLPGCDLNHPGSGMLRAARYFWELALPRRLLNRPPALSTAWMVNRRALLDIGGFKSARRSVMPERQFAWEFAKAGNYLFLGKTAPDLLLSQKSAADQRSTALRLRYPQLRKRPENVAAYVLVFALLYLLPVAVFVLKFWSDISVWLAILALLSLMLAAVCSGLMYQVGSRSFLIGLLATPGLLATDLVTVLVSMYKYELGDVSWKDRNICLPVMHVVPKLPDS